MPTEAGGGGSSSGVGVPGICEQPCECWDLNLNPLGEQTHSSLLSDRFSPRSGLSYLQELSVPRSSCMCVCVYTYKCVYIYAYTCIDRLIG